MTLDELKKKYAGAFIRRDRDANKGTYGKLLIIAGSYGMAGAAYLSGLSAFRTGIGMVKYFGPDENRVILQSLLPEAMYESDDDELKKSLKWADYVVLGPGLSKKIRAKNLIKRLCNEDMASILRLKALTVIDADALNIISQEGLELKDLDAGEGTNIAVTPHVAEMRRLLTNDIKKEVLNVDLSSTDLIKKPEDLTYKSITENAVSLVCAFSHRHGVMTVLKDSVTTVSVRKDVYRIDAGSPAMAKAGSGDVLTGFLIGTAAVLKGNTVASVPLGVYLHGLAGTLAAKKWGPHSILSSDIADMAGAAFAKLAEDTKNV